MKLMAVTERQDLRAAELARRNERCRIASELVSNGTLAPHEIARLCCISPGDMARLVGQVRGGTR